jgi:hypothetical protein
MKAPDLQGKKKTKVNNLQGRANKMKTLAVCLSNQENPTGNRTMISLVGNSWN